MTSSFHSKSYALHSAEFCEYAAGKAMGEFAQSWFRSDTVNAWRHRRMYGLADPILNSDRGASWLTVGDGRFGADARYLADSGAQALASDISDVLLKEAHDSGFIGAYSRQNAEALGFDDDSFDYTLCKESYHHFPRPMLALYEMIRVSRKAVLLIEPSDRYIPGGIFSLVLRRTKDILARLRNKPDGRAEYEPVGNFIFRVSIREIEKVALGLNFPAIAFKGINDAYIAGVESEPWDARGPLRRRVKLSIRLKDILCKLGMMEHSLTAAIIFKEDIPEVVLRALIADGFEIRKLPRNPYG